MKEQRKDHFGKHRTYRCPACHCCCFRPLHEAPRPCSCGRPVEDVPFVLDDSMVTARNGDYVGQSFG